MFNGKIFLHPFFYVIHFESDELLRTRMNKPNKHLEYNALTSNIWKKVGAVNGATGTVKAIPYESNKQ